MLKKLSNEDYSFGDELIQAVLDFCIDLLDVFLFHIVVNFLQLGNASVQQSFFQFFKTDNSAQFFFKKLFLRFQEEIDNQENKGVEKDK